MKSFLGPTSPANFKAVHPPNAVEVLMLTWDEPRFITGSLNSYIIYYRIKGTTNWMDKTTVGSAKGFNISSFDIGRKYETYVVAVDSNGEGKDSRIVSVTTLNGESWNGLI